ncbi:heme NO-binding domain-containing protein [Alteromonas sp. RKMC-009]|uniref:heme NO-binding domain-containing protein n=1 Tax=Alteromonas sp. RKMC-009 TaxID=2267264 RepID=UPI000C52D916|nr:heme NO-binding domain-containing protein [Alteromonas sp. RKMC-009]AYA65913.1 2,4-dihydroxyhept-2-ene-1,7-dioic acid aldolase [Alteromonas sp. RKMC-009]MBT81219.1 2,4-dihydroxyhept-2-ene-1,7-dioic acid aldolase [Alteromonadaceae bacterium]MEC7689458.1 heme NO-binding domain-containing protein [Pseudomonadota bacterium]
MLGIVFTTLVEMLEEKVSPEFADEVIVAANLENDGAYTSVGYYPFSEMQKLVGVLVEKTGKPAEELLHDFGYYLFGRLASAHGQVMAGRSGILDALSVLDNDIHVQVRKLYPDADLPTFKVLSKTDNTMLLEYYSTRELHSLAEGLMDAAADHFGQTIQRTTVRSDKPHTYEFNITVES